eukprot:3941002-Rhodomonas_salina.8
MDDVDGHVLSKSGSGVFGGSVGGFGSNAPTIGLREVREIDASVFDCAVVLFSFCWCWVCLDAAGRCSSRRTAGAAPRQLPDARGANRPAPDQTNTARTSARVGRNLCLPAHTCRFLPLSFCSRLLSRQPSVNTVMSYSSASPEASVSGARLEATVFFDKLRDDAAAAPVVSPQPLFRPSSLLRSVVLAELPAVAFRVVALHAARASSLSLLLPSLPPSLSLARLSLSLPPCLPPLPGDVPFGTLPAPRSVLTRPVLDAAAHRDARRPRCAPYGPHHTAAVTGVEPICPKPA